MDFYHKSLIMTGKVYIASMNLRGKWAERPEGVEVVNVTSAQSKTSKNRLAFSPMNTNSYKGFYNFEAYWQSGKIFEGVSPSKSVAWWKAITSPKRRYPGSKGKKVLCARFPGIEGDLGYVESRKAVYVPEYYELVKDCETLKILREKVESSKSIVVYDFDGPRSDIGDPLCKEVSLDLLAEKLNDPSKPFGHGYIVAGAIRGLSPSMYM